MPDHQITPTNIDPIQHLDNEFSTALARHSNLAGCFSILGPIELCYSAEGGGFKVCLKLAGVEITCVNINPQNPCAKLEGNVVCAKASVEVCITGNCLTYKAQACYKDFPCLWGDWKCADASGTIICL